MIQDYGWSHQLQEHFHAYAQTGLVPGRVIIQHRGRYQLVTELGEILAEISGRFAYDAADGDYPVAGDWVALMPNSSQGTGRIQAVLPRHTAFIRKAAGPRQTAQVVAANIDVVLVIASVNSDLNIRRLERYLVLAKESGARPVIGLTKADLHARPQDLAADVSKAVGDVPVLLVSAVTGLGLDDLRDVVRPGETTALLGSSGVGKSSLLNVLAGRDLMSIGAIRECDERGRHTTTHRELVRLEDGRLLLDTPGMRELGLWTADDGLSSVFADIEDMAGACRFRNCRHDREPGCAVRSALKDGTLDPGRWQGFEKLQRELAHAERKEDPAARAAHKKLWIGRHKAYRALVRHREQDE